jgi:hypothetical protein
MFTKASPIVAAAKMAMKGHPSRWICGKLGMDKGVTPRWKRRPDGGAHDDGLFAIEYKGN